MRSVFAHRHGLVLIVVRIVAAVTLLTMPELANAKYTVCTITINSADEGELFKSKLKPASDFEFLEIVPERAQSDAGGTAGKSGGENWFQEACAKLKAEQKSCDLLVISGHFGGTFFGSSGRRLPLEVLEEMGCNDSCPGIMHSPKEVFMFGCNTLAGKGADDRSPEEFRAILRNEVEANGNRVFTDAQVDEIVAFRYSEFGQANKDRMSRAFSGVSHLYGFESVAPTGAQGKTALTAYLDAVPNYAMHILEIELKRVPEAFEQMQEGHKALLPATLEASPNEEIAKVFSQFKSMKNFAQCSGSPGADSAEFCRLFDQSIPMNLKLASLKKLLTGTDGSKYLALAKQFFEKYPPAEYNDAAKGEFDQIRTNPIIVDRFNTTLKALEKMPVLALGLVDLGENLRFLSKEEATSRKEDIFASLVNSGTIEAKDLVCSQKSWPELPASKLSTSVYHNEVSLTALSCMIPTPTGFGDKLVGSLTDENKYVRGQAAWLIGMSQDGAAPKNIAKDQIEKGLIKLLSDKDQKVKQMAAWALHRITPKDPQTLKEIANRLDDPDVVVRRDLAMALYYSNAKDPTTRAGLEKAKKDSDSIVKFIAESALSKDATAREQSAPNFVHEASQAAIPPCSQVDSNTKDTKVSCTTVKGAIFERVKNAQSGALGWRDKAANRVWMDEIKSGPHQYEAEIHCDSKSGQTLPTRDDFYVAESHGFRDVVKGVKSKWAWSSSGNQSYPYNAFALYGDNGNVRHYNRDGSSDYVAALCVAR